LSLQAEFDENCLKGVLDQLILIQKQEVGTDDPVMDDGAIQGIMLDLIVGGMCIVYFKLLELILLHSQYLHLV